MKQISKLPAMLLVLCVCLNLLSGCGGGEKSVPDGESADAAADKDTIVAAVSGLQGIFSPFFALSAADQDIVKLTQVFLLGVDREGSPVLKGIKGEKRDYRGTEYTYTGASDITVTEYEDGTVDYEITIRDDMRFSDGTPVDIDDVIFSLYVCADPTYDGASRLSECPIQGMAEYRDGMRTLAALLAEAGEDNEDFSRWTEQQQTAFWAAVNDGGVRFVQEIVENCAAAGLCAEGDIAGAAACWGYTLEEDATEREFFQAIGDRYAWSFSQMEEECVNTALLDLIPAEVYAFSTVGIVVDASAADISGIQRLSDNSLRITATEPSPETLYELAIPIAPLHYYGSESEYDYNSGSFGFQKGDLSPLRAKNETPLGGGAYAFESHKGKTVTLRGNTDYFKGAPKTRYLKLVDRQETDMVTGMYSGSIEIANPAYNAELAQMIAEYDAEGAVITTKLTDSRDYGYIGVNAERVKVGDDPASEASKNLRKAIATVLAACREESVSAYYGSAASVLQYPISGASWAAPQDTDIPPAYGVDRDGNEIYTGDLSGEQRRTAALQAALGFFEAAGYTLKDGKLTAAPEGAKLEYEIDIDGGGTEDHPSFQLLQDAAEALNGIGFRLVIHDVERPAELFAAYQSGTSDLWCAAWRADRDPDMFQRYHSDGTSNYFRIADDTLDRLIERARTSADAARRGALYREAMDILVDWGVEIPVYQRATAYLISTEGLDASSVPADMTVWWNWVDAAELLAR